MAAAYGIDRVKYTDPHAPDDGARFFLGYEGLAYTADMLHFEQRFWGYVTSGHLLGRRLHARPCLRRDERRDGARLVRHVRLQRRARLQPALHPLRLRSIPWTGHTNLLRPNLGIAAAGLATAVMLLCVALGEPLAAPRVADAALAVPVVAGSRRPRRRPSSWPGASAWPARPAPPCAAPTRSPAPSSTRSTSGSPTAAWRPDRASRRRPPRARRRPHRPPERPRRDHRCGRRADSGPTPRRHERAGGPGLGPGHHVGRRHGRVVRPLGPHDRGRPGAHGRAGDVGPPERTPQGAQ